MQIQADTSPTIREPLVHNPSRSLDTCVAQVPKQVKHLALMGSCLSHSRALAFFQGTLLGELCIAILHSYTSFFPSLLREAQNNPGG